MKALYLDTDHHHTNI